MTEVNDRWQEPREGPGSASDHASETALTLARAWARLSNPVVVPFKRLGEIQDAWPHIDLGSYPFHRDELYGTTLVMRGTDEAALDAMLDEVSGLITELGAEPLDVQKG